MSIFVASDATPIVEYTNDVIYLNDFELAVITNNGSWRVTLTR